MPTQHSGDVDETLAYALPPKGRLAVREAREATDNAIRSIFELARSLEFLTEALGRLNADSVREAGPGG